MVWMIILLCAAVLAYRYLKGADLREFDRPTGAWFDTTAEEAEAIRTVEVRLRAMLGESEAASGWRDRLAASREMAEKISDGLVFSGRVETVDINGIAAEWVVAQGADTARRALVIHGGAFALGSPKGHRKLSANISSRASAAVLAVDYSLWPEHHRKQAIADVRAAWRFMLDNGPDGSSPAQVKLLVGDSAGGNLALATSAWLRDQQHGAGAAAQADAVIAICPVTDSTLSGPSAIYNASTDILLGAIGRLMRRFSHAAFVLIATLLYRMHLASPDNSPVFGSLHGLPPTLVHSSDCDILFSDAQRYTNKARRDGSSVTLQVWHGMQHDWHMFADELQATQQAWQAIGDFVELHCPALQRAG
ncbi:MAG: alpha/beta hydrolase [Pseudomonadales bacterium]